MSSSERFGSVHDNLNCVSAEWFDVFGGCRGSQVQRSACVWVNEVVTECDCWLALRRSVSFVFIFSFVHLHTAAVIKIHLRLLLCLWHGRLVPVSATDVMLLLGAVRLCWKSFFFFQSQPQSQDILPSSQPDLWPHLLRVDAFGHGPGGDDVVHHALAQPLGNLVELQEVPHVVEHLVVAVGVGVHLLEDGGHVSKDGGVEQSWRGWHTHTHTHTHTHRRVSH